MVNVCQLAGGVPILLFLDRIGRRRLAILGGLVMDIPYLLTAGLMGNFSGNWSSHQGLDWFCVALIFMCL